MYNINFSDEPLNWLKYHIFDNTEVLSTLFVLIVLATRPRQPAYLKPVITYLFIALFLYSIGNLIAELKSYLPTYLQSNNVLYNIHSLIRFTCFAIYFKKLHQPYYTILKKLLPLASILFVVVYFGFMGVDFFYPKYLSSRLLTVEALLLLIYCMLYYLALLKQEEGKLAGRKDFWVTTGLSFYVVINFFVFLLYADMSNDDKARVWDIHNIAQIIFCILIAKAFYVPDTD